MGINNIKVSVPNPIFEIDNHDIIDQIKQFSPDFNPIIELETRERNGQIQTIDIYMRDIPDYTDFLNKIEDRLI